MSALGHKQILFSRFLQKRTDLLRLSGSAALRKQMSYFVRWKSRIRLFERSSSAWWPIGGRYHDAFGIDNGG
jgi:hypothetical protein